MKLLAITLLALFMAQTAFAVACTATCAADKCCSTTEAAATPQTCTTSMLNAGGTAYTSSWESATDKTCKTITATAGSCVKADYTYAAAGTGECVDQTKLSCVSLTSQTTTTDKTTAKCIGTTTDKYCTLIYASNAFTNGWTSTTDFTCAPIVSTIGAPKCVNPSTYVLSAALTSASTQCFLDSDKSCQTLTYANTAKRYAFTVTTAGSENFKCDTTNSLKCGTAICQVSECCTGTTCTASTTSTTKKCLTSATDINCLDQTASQYFKAAGDASCDSTVATKTTQCIDTTTRLLKTLVATDAFCVHTDQTCKATTTTLKQTSATDFTCLDSTATTTTTTTTGSNLLYIIGTIIFLISTILI